MFHKIIWNFVHRSLPASHWPVFLESIEVRTTIPMPAGPWVLRSVLPSRGATTGENQ